MNKRETSDFLEDLKDYLYENPSTSREISERFGIRDVWRVLYYNRGSGIKSVNIKILSPYFFKGPKHSCKIYYVAGTESKVGKRIARWFPPMETLNVRQKAAFSRYVNALPKKISRKVYNTVGYHPPSQEA